MRKRWTATNEETIRFWILGAVLLVPAVQVGHAQGILGTNLVVNGNAEAGPTGTLTTVATSIPGWTKIAGQPNVLPYGITGNLFAYTNRPPQITDFNILRRTLDSRLRYYGTVIMQIIDVSASSLMLSARGI